jgi:hypothetical protein
VFADKVEIASVSVKQVESIVILSFSWDIFLSIVWMSKLSTIVVLIRFLQRSPMRVVVVPLVSLINCATRVRSSLKRGVAGIALMAAMVSSVSRAVC